MTGFFRKLLNSDKKRTHQRDDGPVGYHTFEPMDYQDNDFTPVTTQKPLPPPPLVKDVKYKNQNQSIHVDHSPKRQTMHFEQPSPTKPSGPQSKRPQTIIEKSMLENMEAAKQSFNATFSVPKPPSGPPPRTLVQQPRPATSSELSNDQKTPEHHSLLDMYHHESIDEPVPQSRVTSITASPRPENIKVTPAKPVTTTKISRDSQLPENFKFSFSVDDGSDSSDLQLDSSLVDMIGKWDALHDSGAYRHSTVFSQPNGSGPMTMFDDDMWKSLDKLDVDGLKKSENSAVKPEPRKGKLLGGDKVEKGSEGKISDETGKKSKTVGVRSSMIVNGGAMKKGDSPKPKNRMVQFSGMDQVIIQEAEDTPPTPQDDIYPSMTIENLKDIAPIEVPAADDKRRQNRESVVPLDFEGIPTKAAKLEKQIQVFEREMKPLEGKKLVYPVEPAPLEEMQLMPPPALKPTVHMEKEITPSSKVNMPPKKEAEIGQAVKTLPKMPVEAPIRSAIPVPVVPTTKPLPTVTPPTEKSNAASMESDALTISSRASTPESQPSPALSNLSVSTPTKRKIKRRHIQIQARPVEFSTIALQCNLLESKVTPKTIVAVKPVMEELSTQTELAREQEGVMEDEMDALRTQNVALRMELEHMQTEMEKNKERFENLSEQAYIKLRQLVDERMELTREIAELRQNQKQRDEISNE